MKLINTVQTLALALAGVALPAAAQAGFCDNGACNEHFDKSASLGNSNFGGGYDFDFRLYNKDGHLADLDEWLDSIIEVHESMNLPAPVLASMVSMFEQQYAMQVMMMDMHYPDDHTKASADADVDVTIFSNDLTILGINGYARLDDGTIDYETSATVLGADVDALAANSGERELMSVSMTFFSTSTTFMAGPIPITVSGDVTGTLALSGQLTTLSGGVELGLTPSATLTAGASAGVGVLCASAGVRGELNLIEVAAPGTLKVQSASCGVRGAIEGDVELSSMSGSVEVYAEACGLSWSKTLAEWDPAAQETFPIIDQSVCL